MKRALKTMNEDFQQKKFSVYDLLGYSVLVGMIIKSLSLI